MQTIAERSIQGMTDKQFEAYQKGLLRQLEYAEQDLVSAKDEEKEKLQLIISDLREALSRP